jgi:hypothetical protein
MEKTKTKQRIENAFNAFFDDEVKTSLKNNLCYASQSDLLKQETAELFEKKADILVKILKRTFLFLPGTIYLFFGTISILEFNFLQNEPFAILMVFLIGSFMTIFGIGDLKNPKHLAIPLSIVSVAVFTFSLFWIFQKTNYAFEFGMYLFPLALIMPILIKDRISDSRS